MPLNRERGLYLIPLHRLGQRDVWPMSVKALCEGYSLQGHLLEHCIIVHVLGHPADTEVTAQGNNAAYQCPILLQGTAWQVGL